MLMLLVFDEVVLLSTCVLGHFIRMGFLTTNDKSLLPAPIMGRHPFVNLYISLTACKECLISLSLSILVDYESFNAPLCSFQK